MAGEGAGGQPSSGDVSLPLWSPGEGSPAGTVPPCLPWSRLRSGHPRDRLPRGFVCLWLWDGNGTFSLRCPLRGPANGCLTKQTCTEQSFCCIA